jgi:succinate dehydrogenase subunit C
MFTMKQPTISQSPVYTEFHPRWYRPPVSVYWWLGEWHYLKFILREISSVFVAWFVILTLVQLWALRSGPESYARFEHWLQNPVLLAVNIISLFFVVFHAVTWFNLAPKAMAVRFRGKRLPDILLSAPNYAMWAVVSVAVGWVLLR